MSVTKRRVARKLHRCSMCRKEIEPGFVYLEHVAFPGDEGHEEGSRPWRLRECSDCAFSYGLHDQRFDLLEPYPPDNGQTFRYWLADSKPVTR